MPPQAGDYLDSPARIEELSPAAGSRRCRFFGLEPADVRENTRRLLATLTELHVPVVGFVNEGKLFMEGEGPADAEARKAVLKMWVDEYIQAAVYTRSSPWKRP